MRGGSGEKKQLQNATQNNVVDVPIRNNYLDRVCYDLNVLFTAESQPPANANSQALRAVIYLKLELEGTSKDAMNAILPKGLSFFTS